VQIGLCGTLFIILHSESDSGFKTSIHVNTPDMNNKKSLQIIFPLITRCRLWDAGKSGNSICELKLPQNVEGPPLASFDSTGLVFGVTAKMAGDEGNVSCLISSFTI